VKKPAKWKFLVVAVLLMGIGGGITYAVIMAKFKRDWAAAVPARPAGEFAEVAKIAVLEDRIRSGDTIALVELAEIYGAGGAFAPALQAWETLIALNPRRGDWWLAAAELQAAGGESRVAKRRLKMARELGLPNGDAHWRAGQVAERLGEQIEAKADYLRAVELSPETLPAWLRLLSMYRSIGDDREARRTFDAALAENPDAVELLMDRGQRFRDRGNWSQALADFERVMELRPDLAAARYATAQAYFQLERRAAGTALLTEHLVERPDDEVALMLLCVEALANGDRSAADAWLARLRDTPAFGEGDEARMRAAYVQQFGEPPPEE